MVLLLALLAVVALELTAVTLHFAALQQTRAARAGTRALQLRLSAQSAAAAAVAGWPAAQALAATVGAPFSIAAAAAREHRYGIEASATGERLADSLFLIAAEARSPLLERARVGLLVVTSDPARALAGGALRSGGSVTLGPTATVAARSPVCPSDAGSLAVELPDANLLSRAPGATLGGDVAFVPAFQGAPLTELLSLPLAQLLDAAVTVPAGSVTPVPVEKVGACATATAGNWGEPDASAAASPCAQWYPVLRREGDLTLQGGRGQGVLYVVGNLVLTAGASFSGLVIVAGRLTVTGGATLTGMVISGGGAEVNDGELAGNRCVLRAALSGVRSLAGPYTPPGRRWIPLF